jgi:excisionase family DNA binding protein
MSEGVRMAVGSSQRGRTLLTEQEVADVFRVTSRTVRRWATAGTLEAIRVGGVTRYRADAVTALVGPINDQEPAANGPLGKTGDGTAHASAG